MPLFPGSAYYGEFITATASGAATDATGTPVVTANRNGADDSAFVLTVTYLDTGRYSYTGTVPSTYVSGDCVSVTVEATVSAVDQKFRVDSFIVADLSQAYPDGKLYFDSVSGAAGAAVGVNGTVSNPCSAEADILSLVTSTLIKRVWLNPGSTWVAAANPGDVHFESDGKTSATYNFNGQNPGNSTYRNLHAVSGSALPAPIVLLEDCSLAGNFYGTPLHMLKCVMGNMFFDQDAITSIWWLCYSDTASIQLDFTGLASLSVLMEQWSGWAYVSNLTHAGSGVYCLGDGVLGFNDGCTAGFGTFGGTVHIEDGTNAGAGGAISIQSAQQNFPGTFGLTAGQDCLKFPFLMYDTSGALVGGKSPAGQISVNGAAYGDLTNTPGTSVGSGGYVIDIAAADIPANTLPDTVTTALLKFSATGCKDTILPVILQQPFTTVNLG